MKKNIDYKLVKNKIFNKSVCISILVVLILLELWTFHIAEQKKEEVAVNQYILKEEESLKEFIIQLEKNEINILNMNKKSRGYEFKVMVRGTKEEIKKKVEDLVDFNITSYNIGVKDQLIKGTLTISTIS